MSIAFLCLSMSGVMFLAACALCVRDLRNGGFHHDR